jgi:hypothetical protein
MNMNQTIQVHMAAALFMVTLNVEFPLGEGMMGTPAVCPYLFVDEQPPGKTNQQESWERRKQLIMQTRRRGDTI